MASEPVGSGMRSRRASDAARFSVAAGLVAMITLLAAVTLLCGCYELVQPIDAPPSQIQVLVPEGLPRTAPLISLESRSGGIGGNSYFARMRDGWKAEVDVPPGLSIASLNGISADGKHICGIATQTVWPWGNEGFIIHLDDVSAVPQVNVAFDHAAGDLDFELYDGATFDLIGIGWSGTDDEYESLSGIGYFLNNRWQMETFERWYKRTDSSCCEAYSSSLHEDIYPETISSLYLVGKIESSIFLEHGFLVFC